MGGHNQRIVLRVHGRHFNERHAHNREHPVLLAGRAETGNLHERKRDDAVLAVNRWRLRCRKHADAGFADLGSSHKRASNFRGQLYSDKLLERSNAFLPITFTMRDVVERASNLSLRQTQSGLF